MKKIYVTVCILLVCAFLLDQNVFGGEVSITLEEIQTFYSNLALDFVTGNSQPACEQIFYSLAADAEVRESFDGVHAKLLLDVAKAKDPIPQEFCEQCVLLLGLKVARKINTTEFTDLQQQAVGFIRRSNTIMGQIAEFIKYEKEEYEE